MMKRAIVAFTIAGLSIARLAAAAEGESNLFAGDLGNAVWALVIFVAVILVLGKLAWGPLLEVLQSREEFIRDSLEQARDDREKAEERLKEYTERVETARTEATAIVEEGRRDAEVVKVKIEEQAQEEAGKMIERAKREIEIAKQTAVKDLYEESSRLATELASRIIRKELSPADHERLIRESIQELSDRKTN